jgi:thiamine pyrophosphokinase
MINTFEVEGNVVDMTFLDCEEKCSNYTILILINKTQFKNVYFDFIKKTDYIIFAEESVNEMFDEYGYEFLPDCVIGNLDNILPEVELACKYKKVKMINRSDEGTSDLEKSLYFSLEKFSESNYGSTNSTIDEILDGKKRVIVYADYEKRFDRVLSFFNEIFKFTTQYEKEIEDIDIFIFSNSSISFLLKPGENIIYPSFTKENKKCGYSLVSLCGEIHVQIYEKNFEDDNFIFITGINFINIFYKIFYYYN